MALSQYEAKEQARQEIGKVIREELLYQFRGVPCITLRNKAESIRSNNREIVRAVLKQYGCEDHILNWKISYDFKDDPDGIARVSDFSVSVEAGTGSYGPGYT